MNRTYLNQTLRFLLVIGIVLFGTVALYYVSKVTYPFIIGLVIAFLINPFVSFLERKIKLHRGIAVIVAMILIFAIFAGLITLLVAELVSGANYLARVLPDHIETLITFVEEFFAAQIIPFYNQMANLFDTLDSGQQETIMQNIKNVGATITTSAGQFIQSFFGKIPDFISWFPNAATTLIFSILATFFISKDWDRISNFAGKILPNKAKTSSKTVYSDLKKALFGFLKAQLILISMTTVVILIGLLVLRVDHAVTIAIVTGLVDILPYLGTGLIFVPWIIYEIIIGETGLAIGLTVLYLIVLVQRQVMEPKILSSNIGLDPLATLLALFIGVELLGFLGLILGPVTLVIIMTLNRANIFREIWAFIKGKPV